MIDISHLPKSMQRRPEIRALTLKVYPNGPGAYQVPGTDRIHDVFVHGDTYHCTCPAGMRDARCAHVIAVERYIKEH